MTQRKKILHLITGLEVGGAEMMLLKTLPRLQSEFDNRVCCIRGHGPIGTKLEAAGVPVSYLELRSPFDFGVILRFRKIVRKFQPEILVTYLIHADLFGRVFGRIFGIPKIVCSIRVKLTQFGYFPLLLMERASSFLVDRYHFNAQSTADFYSKWLCLPKKRMVVIPNGIELRLFSSSIIQKNKTIEHLRKENNFSAVVGCVAKLRKQKGHKYLISSFSEIAKNDPRVALVIVGDGTERHQLEEQVRHLRLERNIFFLGDQNDIPTILRSLDIFVFPTLFEGMSNALLEAMASNLAIVATDIPENQELLTNRESGILIPKKDSHEITKAIQLLLRDDALRHHLEKNAREITTKSFDVELTILKMRDFLKTV